MKTMIKMLLPFCFSLIIHVVFADNNLPDNTGGDDKSKPGISGIILDAREKVPMEYANVRLFSKADSSLITGTITNNSGSFSLKNIPSGEYYLVIDFIGYEKKVIDNISITEKSKNIALQQIFLEGAASQLGEVNIVAEKDYVQYKIDKKVVNVAKNPNSSGGTASDALRDVPSVTVDADGTVSLRGSTNFTVLVDGKPSALSGNDLLRQIPAATIENIEVITNPSAKYDPNGTSGIINIVLKKNYQNGINGIVNASAGMGEKYSGDFLINYRKDKWNYFISANANTRLFTGTSDVLRTDRLGINMDSVRTSDVFQGRSFRTHGMNYKGGADFYVNDKNSISFSQEYGIFGFTRSIFSVNKLASDVNLRYFTTDDDFVVDGDYYTSYANYQHKFKQKGHEWNTSLNYTYFSGIRTEEVLQQNTDASWQSNGNTPYRFKSLNDVLRNFGQLKTDYTMPIGNNKKIEAGYHYDLSYTDLAYQTQLFDDAAQQWRIQNNEKYKLPINQEIHAAYTTFSSNIRKIDYQLGLRYEYLYRDVNASSEMPSTKIQLNTFYPSVHASYKLPKEQQLQLSFSKKTNRPQDWMLNPYPNYSDGLFRSVGNAKLKPENIFSYELGYMKNLKKSFISVTTFYRETKDLLSQKLVLLSNGEMLQTFDNYNRQYSYGIESMLNLTMNKWLRVNATGSFFHYHIKTDFEENTSVNNKTETYYVRVVPTFTLPKGTIIQFTNNYNGPGYFAQFKTFARYTADIAVKHDFLKKKFSVTLRGSDIFATGKFKIEVNDKAYSVKQSILGEQQMLTLSVSYKINNFTRNMRQGDNTQFEGSGM